MLRDSMLALTALACLATPTLASTADDLSGDGSSRVIHIASKTTTSVYLSGNSAKLMYDQLNVPAESAAIEGGPQAAQMKFKKGKNVICGLDFGEYSCTLVIAADGSVVSTDAAQ
jgi:hypothetical protein